ncbi:MAG: TetR/AcrR family transcriptional regulator [Acidimicrobiales bacterium]
MGGGGEESRRRLRADAFNNRHALLAVAVSMLSRSNEDVSLEAIAREAGVGIGTLYRHFPTRESLVVEAYGDEIDQLCTAISGLLATLPPQVALREWMQWFVDYVTAKRNMPEALNAAVDVSSGRLADTRDQIIGALRTLMEAGSAAGSIRGDVDAEDVLCMLRGIWMVSGDPSRPDQARRLLNLLMDGLQAAAPAAGRGSAGGGTGVGGRRRQTGSISRWPPA